MEMLYLADYQKKRNSCKVTIDNMRRIFSSFFGWLEDEDYIIKSPVRRIHKIKTEKTVKDTFSDEGLELLRDACDEVRDLAMGDFQKPHSHIFSSKFSVLTRQGQTLIQRQV